MELGEDDPRRIGPWAVQSVHFKEPGRASYAARINSMSADILVLDVPSQNRLGLRSNLQKSKTLSTLEIPRVLDASLDSVPQWIACDPVSGERLSEYLIANKFLPKDLWAELARTSLIGCAALRSADIKGFQMSLNTFVLDGNDIHMADVWAGSMQPSDLYPPDKTRLSDLMAVDDKFAIGRLLASAMGVDISGESLDMTAATTHGFDEQHIAFVQMLMRDDRSSRPTTESALKAIPGRRSEWAIPVFALDKPGRQRAKRKLQRGLIWASVGAVIVAMIAGLVLWLTGDSGTEEGEVAQAIVVEASPDPVVELRLSLAKGDFEPVIFTDADEYSLEYCYPDANLNMDEIPDRLVFQQLNGEKWITDDSVKVQVKTSTTCPDGESAVTFTTAAPPRGYLTDDWTPCRDFRVLIPRLSSDKRAPVRFCLQQRKTSETPTAS